MGSVHRSFSGVFIFLRVREGRGSGGRMSSVLRVCSFGNIYLRTFNRNLRAPDMTVVFLCVESYSAP